MADTKGAGTSDRGFAYGFGCRCRRKHANDGRTRIRTIVANESFKTIFLFFERLLFNVEVIQIAP
jgi:hypothetical protein